MSVILTIKRAFIRSLPSLALLSLLLGSCLLLSEPALAAKDILDAMYTEYQTKVFKLIKYLELAGLAFGSVLSLFKSSLGPVATAMVTVVLVELVKKFLI